MKEQDNNGAYAIKTRLQGLAELQKILLHWAEIGIACVLFSVLLYLFFLSPADIQNKADYQLLVVVETAIVFVALIFNLRGHFHLSSNLFILAGIIGPWWSAFMDPTVLSGNIFPLAYTVVPILFSSFFSPVHATISVGLFQILALAWFIHLGDFDLSQGAASLFFFVLFMFGFSLIFNIQNRNNRKIISDQFMELEDLAVRDPLTGLNNRRFLLEFLEVELARMTRQDQPLSLLMLDIDDFKHMNDACGHSDGDAIILAIADALKAHFRDSDIISRYGGDEFLILMSGSSGDHASERAGKLQQKIAQESFNQNCEDARKVTVSIGIASFPLNGKTVDSLIKAADAALYRAKAQGKNRIEVG